MSQPRSTNEQKIAMLLTVTSPQGFKSEPISADVLELLAKLNSGRNTDDLLDALKIAVQAGLVDQVDFYYKAGVDFSSPHFGVAKLAMLAWLQGPEMFKKVIACGARVFPDEARAMGADFNRDYQAATKQSKPFLPPKPTGHSSKL